MRWRTFAWLVLVTAPLTGAAQTSHYGGDSYDAAPVHGRGPKDTAPAPGDVDLAPPPPPRELTAKETLIKELQDIYDSLNHELNTKVITYPRSQKKALPKLKSELAQLKILIAKANTLPEKNTAAPPSEPLAGENPESGASYGNRLKGYLLELGELDQRELAKAKAKMDPAYLPPPEEDFAAKLTDLSHTLQELTATANFNPPALQQTVSDHIQDIDAAGKTFVKPPTPPASRQAEAGHILTSFVPQTLLQFEVLRQQSRNLNLSPHGADAFHKLMTSSYRAFAYPNELASVVARWNDRSNPPSFNFMMASHPRETIAAIKKFAELNGLNRPYDANGSNYFDDAVVLTPKLIPVLVSRLGQPDAEDALVALLFQRRGSGGEGVVAALKGKKLLPATVDAIKARYDKLTKTDFTTPPQLIEALIYDQTAPPPLPPDPRLSQPNQPGQYAPQSGAGYNQPQSYPLNQRPQTDGTNR